VVAGIETVAPSTGAKRGSALVAKGISRFCAIGVSGHRQEDRLQRETTRAKAQSDGQGEGHSGGNQIHVITPGASARRHST